MTDEHNLPLALMRAQMTFWMRTGELLQDNRNRWLALAQKSLARDTGEAHVETREAAQAADWSALASLPRHTGWRLLKHGVGNAQDLTLTAINNQTALAAGVQQAMAEWQRETAGAMTQARNAMPFSGTLKSLLQAAAPENQEERR